MEGWEEDIFFFPQSCIFCDEIGSGLKTYQSLERLKVSATYRQQLKVDEFADATKQISNINDNQVLNYHSARDQRYTAVKKEVVCKMQQHWK